MGIAASSAMRNDNAANGPAYGSLEGLGGPRKLKKKPVLVLDPEELEAAHAMFHEASAELLGEQVERAPRPAMILGLAPMEDDDAEEMGESDEVEGDADEGDMPSAEAVLSLTRRKTAPVVDQSALGLGEFDMTDGGLDHGGYADPDGPAQDDIDLENRIFPSLPLQPELAEEEFEAEAEAEAETEAVAEEPVEAAHFDSDAYEEPAVEQAVSEENTAQREETATPAAPVVPAQPPIAPIATPAQDPPAVQAPPVVQTRPVAPEADPPVERFTAASAAPAQPALPPMEALQARLDARRKEEEARQNVVAQENDQPDVAQPSENYDSLREQHRKDWFDLDRDVVEAREIHSWRDENWNEDESLDPPAPADLVEKEASPNEMAKAQVQESGTDFASQDSDAVDVPVPYASLETPPVADITPPMGIAQDQPVEFTQDSAPEDEEDASYTVTGDDRIDGYAFMRDPRSRRSAIRATPQGTQSALRAKLLREAELEAQQAQTPASASLFARLAAWLRKVFGGTRS